MEAEASSLATPPMSRPLSRRAEHGQQARRVALQFSEQEKLEFCGAALKRGAAPSFALRHRGLHDKDGQPRGGAHYRAAVA